MRVKIGITNLDRVLGGGLPEGYCYLLLGGPGAGKTTFGLQYLVNGIMDSDETGIYVTLDEPPYSIVNNARENFAWDLIPHETKHKLALVDASPMDIDAPPGAYRIKGALGSEDFSIESVLGLVSSARRKMTPKAKRCVIDSVSGLLFQYEKPFV
jgi:KaiC/GvpD/RAD55 family RecA-like ATPase